MLYNSKNTNWENIEKGLKKYLLIMQLVRKVNVKESAEFQKLFNGFFRIMKKPKSFYAALYEYLELNKNKKVSFEKTLDYFYQKFEKIEASFSSKIIATINPDFPVWDSEVLKSLNLKAPSYNIPKEKRIRIIISIYENIQKWYSDFLKTEEAKNMIRIFDEKMGKTNLTKTKKIDLILWQTRK